MELIAWNSTESQGEMSIYDLEELGILENGKVNDRMLVEFVALGIVKLGKIRDQIFMKHSLEQGKFLKDLIEL